MTSRSPRRDLTCARRAVAATLVRVVDEGGFSQRVLEAGFERLDLAAVERAWVTATVYGCLADLRALDLALGRLVRKGIVSLPPLVRAHLRVAAWELGRAGRGPEAAIVSGVVDAVRADGEPRLAGLTNGVLRNLLRDRDKLFEPPKKADDVARFGLVHGLPDWIAARLISRLGAEGASGAMVAFNAPSPVGLRVRSGSREEVLAELTAAGLDVRPHHLAPDAIVCDRGYVAGTTAHRERRVVIQDVGARLACAALPPSLGGTVLDACAGIGGKTLTLVDAYGAGAVVVTDSNTRKLRALLNRPELGAVVAVPDMFGDSPPEDAAQLGPFAAVVLDAPCSALGTLGRHPEVRWNRSEGSVAELAALQRRLLDAVAHRVASGGLLLYVVCTWTEEETRDQVASFTARHPDFIIDPPSAESASPRVPWSSLVDAAGAVELWPDRAGTDGFFIARLRRTHRDA